MKVFLSAGFGIWVAGAEKVMKETRYHLQAYADTCHSFSIMPPVPLLGRAGLTTHAGASADASVLCWLAESISFQTKEVVKDNAL